MPDFPPLCGKVGFDLRQPRGEACDFLPGRSNPGARRLRLPGANGLQPGDFRLSRRSLRLGIGQLRREPPDFDLRRRQRLFQRGNVGRRHIRLFRQRRLEPGRFRIRLGQRPARLAQRRLEPLGLCGLHIALGPERGEVLLQRRPGRHEPGDRPVELGELLRLRSDIIPACLQRRA